MNKYKYLSIYFISIIMVFVFHISPAFSQQTGTTIKGTVYDGATGNTLPGTNVVIAGTTQGDVTDAKGHYEISGVSPGTYTLVTSFIGFQRKSHEVTIRQGQEIVTVNFTLQTTSQLMGKLVVTAFSQERKKRSLGTSVGTISTSALEKESNLSVAKSLSGRISGVSVRSSAGGAAGSTKIIIRGYSSLGGNNQPLYVVDGIPIDDGSRGSAGRWGGYDTGDGISDINPNSIESITILKGPNGSALYGQRGANGVVLITTKSGAKGKGVGIDISSSVGFGRPWVLPDFQNVYGIGSNGHHRFYTNGNGHIITREKWIKSGKPSGYIPQVSTINNGIEGPTSWGPKMNGEKVYAYDGKITTFSPQPNNVSDFYNTQTTVKNSIALSGGSKNTTFRLSYANTRNKGLLPQNKLIKHNVLLKGSHDFGDKLTVNAEAIFAVKQIDNIPDVADGQQNIAYQFLMMPRNVRLSKIKQYELTTKDLNNPNAFHGYTAQERQVGYSRHWTNGTYTGNPYWILNNTIATKHRNRLIGAISFDYDLSDWVSLLGKVGVDNHSDKFFSSLEIGTRVTKPGAMSMNKSNFREINSQLLISMNKAVSNDITLDVNVGGHYMNRYYQIIGYSGQRYSVRGLHVIGNTQVSSPSYGLSQRATVSLLAFGTINYKSFLYVNWTARNDWSSTLPVDNASFFYPSVNGNFIWTDALNIDSDILSYGSVRVSWAQAGSSADPYQLSGTYSLSAYTQAGQPMASYTNSLPLQNLQNVLTTSFETGLNLQLFNGRIKTNLTYYSSTTENQILNVLVAPSSGFLNRKINAGQIDNKGIEFGISGTPLRTSNLTWNIGFNFSANRNKVVKLVEGANRFLLGRGRSILIFADPGKPYGELYSSNGKFLRDENGNRLIDPSGLPIRVSGNYPVGNAMPKWSGGITSSLNYKGFNFGFLIDISEGGDIFSQGNAVGVIQGTVKRTLKGRDGFVVEGMAATKNADGEWVSSGKPNTVEVTAQEYWHRIAPGNAVVLAEPFINDASFITLRNVTIGYSFSGLVNESSLLNSLKISVAGHNLYYFQRHTRGFSPEAASFNVSQGSLGFNYASLPIARTVTFKVDIGF